MEEAPRYGGQTIYRGLKHRQADEAKVLLNELEAATLTVDVRVYQGAIGFEEAAGLQQVLLEAKTKIKASLKTARTALESLAVAQLDAKDRFSIEREAFLLTYAAAVEEQGETQQLD